jgi:hypothetical protein
MSGPRPALSDAVMANINGQRDAQRLIHAVRQGCAPADALLEGITQVQTLGDADRVRGFVRELQKVIERAGAAVPTENQAHG